MPSFEVSTMSSPQQSNPPSAHIIAEALARLGHQLETTTLDALIAMVKRLQVGLPAEDEFSMLVSWLGNCRVIHKVDQKISPPNAKNSYEVPDLFAIFDYQGRPIPVFIEVKKKVKMKLSWRPDYYERYQKYSQETGIPVLVACKWELLGMWSLFELKHFQIAETNYNISLETAMKENLLGVLAGDFHYMMQDGVGMHLELAREQVYAQHQTEDGLIEEWGMRIRDAYFTNGQGERYADTPKGLFALMNTVSQVETDEFLEEGLIRKSFTVDPNQSFQMAQTALRILLQNLKKDDEALNWREILETHQVPLECSALREIASNGFGEGYVRYILNQVPNTWPQFLPARNGE